MTQEEYETKQTQNEQERQSGGLADRMKEYATKRNIGLAAAASAAMYFGILTTNIDKDELGVKQNTFSPFGLLGQSGITQDKYETGLHFRIPVIQKMHIFPKEELALHLHQKADEGKHNQYATCINAARIQTSDGFFVDIDASVLYRIKDPHLLIATLGAGKLYETSGLIPRTEPALRDTMGKLNPEDFYDPQKRIDIQEEAKKRLSDVLAKNGIEISQVMIRDVRYHPEIEAKLEQRKVQDQLAQTKIAQREEADQKAILDKIVKEGSAAVDVRKSEAQAYVDNKAAEQQSYETVQKSKADRLVALAEAQKSSLINNAYTGEGSDRLVALKMAEVLRGIDQIVVKAGPNGLNPLDLEATVKTLEGKKVNPK